MNLKDLVSPDNELQQDEFSLKNQSFGKDGSLSVIGFVLTGRRDKSYIIKCTTCSMDAELFGEGLFISSRSSLQVGQIPCGCSKSPRWTKEQYRVLCQRAADRLGYRFIDFIGEWKNNNTKLQMECEKHGEWASGRIMTLINRGYVCPRCGIESIGQGNKKPDEVMIQSFFDSGAFHPETKFWRSEKLDTNGFKVYWHILCPECGGGGESISSNLRKGQRPCSCSTNRQKQAYINLVLDNDLPIAIKFGIAVISDRRLKEQDFKSVYDIRKHSVFTFPDTLSCRAAEAECKRMLECGIVSKTDMSDGYSETTYVTNIDSIIEIYLKYGGKQID